MPEVDEHVSGYVEVPRCSFHLMVTTDHREEAGQFLSASLSGSCYLPSGVVVLDVEEWGQRLAKVA